MLLYGLLLRVYPASFRAEYGEEMRAVFAERRRAASGLGVLAVWLEAVADVVRHALPLHADVLRQDLRYALRSLARAPGFAATVVLVAGLGIGANTAVFTIADLVLVRPLPFDEPHRLVKIWEHPPGYDRMEASPPDYRDIREQATSFAALGAYANQSANLVGSGEPVRVIGVAADASLLPLLGVAPSLGRTFAQPPGSTPLAGAAAADRAGAAGDALPSASEDPAAAGDGGVPVAPLDPADASTIVLSHGLWQRAFGGDPGILGRGVVLDDAPYTVIGVMPRGFHFPDRATEYWIPLRLNPNDVEDRRNNYLEIVARLAPGVTLERARSDVRAVMRRVEEAHPETNAEIGATVNRLSDEVPRQARLLLIALAGASLCVLLIACTNVANLLLARALARRRELAVRSALGAGTQRLVRQLLTESVVLAGLGGAVGIGLAFAALPLLARLVPESLPVAGTPTLDLRVLALALGVTALTGIGFGALPALRAGRRAAGASLRDDGRVSGGRGGRTRGALVVVEVAASVGLLVTCGLLVRALGEVESTDPGFEADGVLTARTWLPWPRYAVVADREAFYARVLDEVRRAPGVTSAAYTSFLPLVMGGGIWPVEVAGREVNRSANETASLRFVTPEYFATMGIPLLRGRGIANGDTQAAQYVAVVSESFAERYWPGDDPLGRTFGFGMLERTVVGVVRDVRVRGLERRSEPQVYLPHRQTPDSSLIGYTPKDLVIRTAGDPLSLAAHVRAAVRSADPAQPVTDVRPLADIVAGDSAARRVQLRVVAVFAALAIMLAAIGLHGLLSFTAAQRSREIGVRLALGARRQGILALVLRDGLVLGGLGIAAGAFLGYAAGQSIQALLAGVGPADAPTFAAAIGVALLVTVIGSLLPAVRAAGTDPNLLLRDG
jgi:predicted permease